MSPQALAPGDRVAYAARFLKATGQQTGRAGERRGVFLGLESWPGYGRVRWDDDAERIAARQGHFFEQDFRDDVEQNGNLISLSAIAKVGSARFACNDL